MSRYIHDKVNHQLIPVSGYGSRMATSIEDKTLTIHGSYANVEGYNYGKADITDAVELIAPIETELVASRAYTIGKQFVYRGFLYKVTAPIALDAPIVIGTNCELAPSVTEQIRTIIQDTGWIALNTVVKYRKINGVVYVKFSSNYSPSTSAWVDLGTLPEGFRPSDYDVRFALDYETSWWADVAVTTSGLVRVLSNFASSGQVSFAT